MRAPLHGSDDEREMSDFGVFRSIPFLIAGYLLMLVIAGALILAVAWIQGDREPFEVLAKLMRTLE